MGGHLNQRDSRNPLGNLTVWKGRSDRFRPESQGSSRVDFLN